MVSQNFIDLLLGSIAIYEIVIDVKHRSEDMERRVNVPGLDFDRQFSGMSFRARKLRLGYT